MYYMLVTEPRALPGPELVIERHSDQITDLVNEWLNIPEDRKESLDLVIRTVKG